MQQELTAVSECLKAFKTRLFANGNISFYDDQDSWSKSDGHAPRLHQAFETIST